MNAFLVTFQGFSSHSLKHLSMATGTYCGQNLRWLCFVTKVRYRLSKKSVVKTLLNFFRTVKAEWPNV